MRHNNQPAANTNTPNNYLRLISEPAERYPDDDETLIVLMSNRAYLKHRVWRNMRHLRRHNRWTKV